MERQILKEELIDFTDCKKDMNLNESGKKEIIYKDTIRLEDVRVLCDEYDENLPIENFFKKFEEASEVLELNQIQKLVFIQKLLKGQPVIFLKSIEICKSYEELKTKLLEEFQTDVTPAKIHEELSKDYKRKEEKHMEYFYRMKKKASQANLDEESLKHYVIKGLNEARNVELQLKNSKDLEDLKHLLKIMDQEKKESENKEKLLQRFPVRQAFIPRTPSTYRPRYPYLAGQSQRFPRYPGQQQNPHQQYAMRQRFQTPQQGFSSLNPRAPNFRPRNPYPRLQNNTTTSNGQS